MPSRKKLRTDLLQFGKKFYKVDIFNEDGWETGDLKSDIEEINPTMTQIQRYQNDYRLHYMSNASIEEF